MSSLIFKMSIFVIKVWASQTPVRLKLGWGELEWSRVRGRWMRQKLSVLLLFLRVGNEVGQSASLLTVTLKQCPGQRWMFDVTFEVLMWGRMFRGCYSSSLDYSVKLLALLYQR